MFSVDLNNNNDYYNNKNISIHGFFTFTNKHEYIVFKKSITTMNYAHNISRVVLSFLLENGKK